MLGGKQGIGSATFKAGLCRMLNGTLAEPYEGATIEAKTTPEAAQKAKTWAKTVDVAEGSWLQLLLDGKAVASLGPREF
jgi:hypothetical protein